MARVLALTACTVDLDSGEVRRGEARDALTPTELRLLGYLAEHRGRLVEPDELLREVWCYAPSVRSRTVQTTINRLRQKVERDASAPDHLRTEYGAGYRLELPDPRGPVRVPALLTPLEPRPEQDAVARALERGARLVTVLGPAGIGKTSLLLALGRALPARGGCWYVDASGIADSGLLAAQIAEALEVASGTDPGANVLRALADRPALLLLDDLDAVVEGAATLIGEWCSRLPELTVVAGCREPLRLGGEVRVRLAPLDAAASERLLRRLLHDRGAPEPSDTAVRAVVDAVEGLPLALELVAGADSEPLDAGVSDLRAMLDLRTDRRDAPEHHRTLSAALRTSWSRREPVERAALAQLALFHGPFTREAAAEVVQLAAWDVDVGRALARLVDASLVHRTNDRWRLLEATRAFVRSEHPADADATARFVRWAVGLPRWARVRGGHVRSLRPERSHVAAALALAATEVDRAELACTLAEIDLRLGLLDAAEERLVALLGGAVGPRSRAVARLVELRVSSGRAEGTLALARDGAHEAESRDDPYWAAILWRQVAMLCRANAPEEALSALARASAQGERAGDDGVVALPLAELGRLRMALGDPAGARAPLIRARDLFDRLGHEAASALDADLARLHARLGDLHAAERHLARARERLDPEYLQAAGAWLTAAAEVAVASGRPEEALTHLDEAVAIAERVGHRAMLATLACERALVLGALDRVAEGLAALAVIDPLPPFGEAIRGWLRTLDGDRAGLHDTEAALARTWAPGQAWDRARAEALHARAVAAL